MKLASSRSTSASEEKLPGWGPPLVALDPAWHAVVAVTGPTTVAFGVAALFTRGGSSGWRRTFSTSGRTKAIAPRKAPTEEDCLQVNDHIIKP